MEQVHIILNLIKTIDVPNRKVIDWSLSIITPNSNDSHSSTIAIGLFNSFSLIADLQCITIHHGEKQTWQVRCWTWARGTINGNNILMIGNQKTPQMGIRQRLYFVKARWTQPYAAYSSQQLVSIMEVRNETFTCWFFFTPYLYLCL